MHTIFADDDDDLSIFSGHLFFLYSLKIFPHYDNLFDIGFLKEYFLTIYRFTVV